MGRVLVCSPNYELFATDYPDDISAVSDMAGDTSLLSVNLNPNIAYHSICVDHLKRRFDLQILCMRKLSLLATKVSSQVWLVEASANLLLCRLVKLFAYGWNVGAMYELNKNNRFSDDF
ncbi:hypothetical protein O9992_28425 [Vibrio lentus]|nr:hypothetical protein [Vibrio lentus]